MILVIIAILWSAIGPLMDWNMKCQDISEPHVDLHIGNKTKVMGAEVNVKQSVDYKIKPGQWVL